MSGFVYPNFIDPPRISVRVREFLFSFILWSFSVRQVHFVADVRGLSTL